MRMVYPVIYKAYPNGQVGAFFPDVPEAITAGRDLAEARSLALDALMTALSGYIDQGRQLPVSNPGPSDEIPGAGISSNGTIVLPPRVAMKLALYSSMLEHRISAAKLAKRLGVKENVIAKLLDIERDASLQLLDAAFHALGVEAELSVVTRDPTDVRIAA